MNAKQRAVLYGAAVVVVLMIVFPPFNQVYRAGQNFDGYYFVGTGGEHQDSTYVAPKPKYFGGTSGGYYSYNTTRREIHVTMLLAQLVGVAIVSAALCLALKDDKGRKP
jgi:hypothetical protein